MPTRPSLLRALAAAPLVAVAVALGQIMYAAHRRDLPALENQDISGWFGDRSLPHLRMVAIGDSSLTGPGVRNLDNIWVRRAAIAISDRFRVELLSLAVGGARADEVLRDQLGPALALRPDIAVVSVGSNDALRTPDLRIFERTMHEIIGPLHEHAAAVVLLGVGDLGTIPRLPRFLAGLLSWRGRQADLRIANVVDRYQRADRIEGWGSITEAFRSGDLELWSDDLFHASDAGHAVFEADAVPVFERALRYLP